MHAKLTIKGRSMPEGAKYPVVVYYQSKGLVIRFSTGVAVLPMEWDEKKQMIRTKSEEAEKQNLMLKKMLTRANEIITWCELRDMPLTVEQFRKEMGRDVVRSEVADWMEEMIGRDYERGVFGKSSYYQRLRVVKRIREFDPKATWADMSRDWIERFDLAVVREFQKKEDEGRAERYNMMKYLKAITRRAMDDGMLKVDIWKGVKLKKLPPRVVYLTADELARLEALYDSRDLLREKMLAWAEYKGMKDERAQQYADTNLEDVRRHIRNFLFQCYSGVRVSDAQRLRMDQIEGEYLIFTPHKTREVSGKEVRLPITIPMRRYMSQERSGRILPGIGSAQKFNEGLKPISWMIGTRKQLTTHVARHTFATMAVAGGVSLISLRDLMGVTSVKTVEIYAHSSLEQQERELRRAFEKEEE